MKDFEVIIVGAGHAGIEAAPGGTDSSDGRSPGPSLRGKPP